MPMAFSDPQSVTISGSAISLPRISSVANGSTYSSSDGAVDLVLSHAYGRRTRRVIRLDHSKYAADVFIPSTNAEVSMSCYMVFDLPKVGYNNTEALAVYAGLKGLMTASSDAAITKLLGGES